MKQEIDALVRNIQTNLASQIDDQLDVVRFAMAFDRLDVAAQSRDILVKWAEDESLSDDDRVYALQQLEALPRF